MPEPFVRPPSRPWRAAATRHLSATALLGGCLLAGSGAGAAVNLGDIRLHSTLQHMQLDGRQPGGACLPGYRWHGLHGGCRTARPVVEREQAACPPGRTGWQWRERQRLAHALQSDPAQVAFDAWQAWQAWDDSHCVLTPPPEPDDAPPGSGQPGHDDDADATPSTQTRLDAQHYVEITLLPQISNISGFEAHGVCVPLHLFVQVNYRYHWDGRDLGLRQVHSPRVTAGLVHDGHYPALLTIDLATPLAAYAGSSARYQPDLSSLGHHVRQTFGAQVSQVTDPLLNRCEVIGATLPASVQVPIIRQPN